MRPLGTVPGAVLFLLAALLAGAAPIHAESENPRERDVEQVPIEAPPDRPRVGERISFHGRWMGLPVGGGSIEVKDLVSYNGRDAYLIEAEGHSNDVLSTFYPIQDLLRSYLDAETLQPLRFEKYQREGHYRSQEIVNFDYERGVATYHSLLNNSTKEISLPADTHDIISAFYWLRMQPIDPSRTIPINIYSDERVYRTEIKPVKTVMLDLLRRGTFPCLMIEPVASFKGIFVRRGRMWVYVTTDAARMPLFVKISTPWGLMTGVIDRESLQRPGSARSTSRGDTLTTEGSAVPES